VRLTAAALGTGGSIDGKEEFKRLPTARRIRQYPQKSSARRCGAHERHQFTTE
jgi:hypothetical protein